MADRLFTEPALAELYDRWAPAQQRGDFGFYLPLVMSAGSVLDVGCGTGELLRLARQAGHTGRLCGLDPAPAMLALARQRPDVEWVLGEAGSAAWRQEFDLVVMTGHAFQVLVSDDEIRAALAGVRAALAPGGRFAFETRNPAACAWEDWIPANAVQVTGPSGAVVTMAHQVIMPFDGATVTFTSSYTSPGWARPEISRSTLRFLSPAELAPFLAGAGLAIREQFGDWDRGPLTRASPEIITIASPAGQAPGAEGVT
jgi:SAM-dependent methyltransferase